MKLFRVVFIRNTAPVPEGLIFSDYVNVVADTAEIAASVVSTSPWHSGITVEELAEVHQIVQKAWPNTNGGKFTAEELQKRGLQAELYNLNKDANRRAAIESTRNSAKASIE